MKILICENNTFATLSKQSPQVGIEYNLEPAESGTNAQNKFFHALLSEWHRTGLHSYDTVDYNAFRNYIKRDYGAGFESFVYATDDGIKKAKTRSEIPEEYNNERYCLGRLKSWSEYTKKERRETCDKVISGMIQSGVNTKKFYEILEGAEKLWK